MRCLGKSQFIVFLVTDWETRDRTQTLSNVWQQVKCISVPSDTVRQCPTLQGRQDRQLSAPCTCFETEQGSIGIENWKGQLPWCGKWFSRGLGKRKTFQHSFCSFSLLKWHHSFFRHVINTARVLVKSGFQYINWLKETFIEDAKQIKRPENTFRVEWRFFSLFFQ